MRSLIDSRSLRYSGDSIPDTRLFPYRKWRCYVPTATSIIVVVTLQYSDDIVVPRWPVLLRLLLLICWLICSFTLTGIDGHWPVFVVRPTVLPIDATYDDLIVIPRYYSTRPVVVLLPTCITYTWPPDGVVLVVTGRILVGVDTLLMPLLVMILIYLLAEYWWPGVITDCYWYCWTLTGIVINCR